jgi:hypothetical protein
MLTVLLASTHQVFAAGTVTPGITTLADGGSSGSIAEWTLAGDYTTPASEFVIGGGGLQYNRLTVGDSQTFTATNGMVVGPSNGSHNLLSVETNGSVNVTGDLRIGTGSISYYSTQSRVDVSGLLQINGNLDLSNGYNATNNTLSIHEGGVARVEGLVNLYNHWAYGNSWLELDGGILAVAGDQTASFADGSSVLTSIKVWDNGTGLFQPVGTFNGQTPVTNSYFNMLQVAYITDPTSMFTGYTVLSAIPEPGSISMLLAFGGIMAFRRRVRT